MASINLQSFFLSLRLFALRVFPLVVGVSIAWVQAEDMEGLWLVDQVTVDASAGDASEARERALAQGERLAFKRLLKQLDYSAEMASQASNDQIHGWMVGFEVHQERTSAQRYRASISYHFDRSGVEAWLKKKGSPPTSEVSHSSANVAMAPSSPSEVQEPALVLPSEKPSAQAASTGEPLGAQVMTLTVAFQTLNQWLDVVRELNKLAPIQDLDITLFAARRGVLSFKSSETPPMLGKTLHKVFSCVGDESHTSFSLSQAHPQQWTLKFGS